eukprot:scaffold17624_cov74-Skeletonema_dohrnii-CCMP3373.AAC.1
MLPAVSDASSGHLRRCSDADTIKQSLSRAKDASILSWPPMRVIRSSRLPYSQREIRYCARE